RYTSGISLGTGSISISLTREAIVDYISWNGTAFTSESGQMTPAAMETSGRVICSHGPIGGFGASVHSGNSANQAVMWTLSGNSTSIAWRNAAGALITTPTAACNAYVTRIGSG